MMPTTASHAGAGSELTLPAFGLIEPERVLAADDLFAVVSDKFPVSPGHTLVIPRRALTRFQELKASEKLRLLEWVDWAQSRLQQTLTPTPEAFNLGVNDGKAAGQTMSQFHFHIIPRHIGDIADPRGGVRWVIPAKAKYW
jgi:diadenosine tetraphosphate (Ap4A) HIT family hydrolase